MELNQIYNGDCLELMKDIPNSSIDLVVCDPPYEQVNGLPLDGWQRRKADTSWDYALDTDLLFSEYERVVREKGIIVMFSNEPYTSEIRTHYQHNIEFSYSAIWQKNVHANSFYASKAMLKYFEDISVFYKKYDTTNDNPVRMYAKNVMEFIGLSLKEINKLLGHRKAEHFFYWDTTQFGLCTEQTYVELIAVFGINEAPFYKSYSELLGLTKGKVFNLWAGGKSKSNILAYPKDSSGLHPTQKPLALIEDLILTFSNESESVLDNCAGSGTTGIACLNTGRNFILMEKDPDIYQTAKDRIDSRIKQMQETPEQLALQKG